MGYAPIDLDSEIEAQLGPECGRLADLVQREGNEFLPSEARVHGHYEHVMDHGKDLHQKIHPGRRIDGNGRFHAMLSDELQGTVQVPAGLIVYGDPISAGRRKLFNKVVGIFDHQVAVERQTGDLAQRLDHGGPHGEVGDKVPVHDVDMENRAAAALRGLDF
jgi:hypothetical protein